MNGKEGKLWPIPLLIVEWLTPIVINYDSSLQKKSPLNSLCICRREGTVVVDVAEAVRVEGIMALVKMRIFD